MSDLFHALRERLLTAGVAPRHARRYVMELREHAADLTAEEMATGLPLREAQALALKRLGGQEVLAQALLQSGEFRSWGARAPWAVYGIAPLLGVLATYGLALGAIVGILVAHRPAPGAHPILPPWFGAATMTLGYLHNLVLPLLTGGALAWMATRQRMPALWPSVALLIVGIVGGAGVAEVQLPKVADGYVELVVGWSFICPYVNLDMALRHIAAILLLTLVPYLAWHIWRKAVPQSPGGPEHGHLIET
ncbi:MULTISPECIES: hypothetical protein [Nitrospirillum]|uniref:Uncharacterized protein n=1 Tax=Nitrospirillum amazonense TaxID=28077 RepID=A0A560GDN2_9PROT|nr:hypothetical protein [Nitrospirillum amazonense]MEC4591061.1 hypothetical protein [Nitrospirillum amazonense]TWB32026.1 hypothetical protein FBZ88_101398 [Nitrospirillum amazonense]